MGQPQYLCLETPQSLRRKVIFWFPNFFSVITLIIFCIAWLTVRLSKKLELNNIPSSVKASFFIVNLSTSIFFGLTTGNTLSLYL